MRMHEIELSVGEALVLGSHILTVMDIEQDRAVLRVDPRDEDSGEAPADSLPEAHRDRELAALPR